MPNALIVDTFIGACDDTDDDDVEHEEEEEAAEAEEEVDDDADGVDVSVNTESFLLKRLLDRFLSLLLLLLANELTEEVALVVGITWK